MEFVKLETTSLNLRQITIDFCKEQNITISTCEHGYATWINSLYLKLCETEEEIDYFIECLIRYERGKAEH